jgi:radical SAM/Cys-rich protein
MLNRAGFGKGSDGQSLTLVYNPRGAFLSPAQNTLEADYKRELKNRYDLTFNRLFAFTNMPVGRFRDTLVRNGNLEIYQEMLASAFNPAALENIMCRSMVSVGWDGRLYDCDFNQALRIPTEAGLSNHSSDFDYARFPGEDLGWTTTALAVRRAGVLMRRRDDIGMVPAEEYGNTPDCRIDGQVHGLG